MGRYISMFLLDVFISHVCPSFTIHPQDTFTFWRIFRNVTVMTNPDSSALPTINNSIPLQNVTTSEDCCSIRGTDVPLLVLDVGPEEVWLPTLTRWSMTNRLPQYPHSPRQFYSKSRTQAHHIHFFARSIKTYYSHLEYMERFYSKCCR